MIAAIVAATGLAWRKVRRLTVSLAKLPSAPGYAFAKVSIYVRLSTARQRQWIRTRHDGGG